MIRVERVLEGPRAYEVVIGQGVRALAGERLAAIGAGPHVAVVTDANVAPLYAEGVEEALRSAGRTAWTHVLAPGEEGKSRASLAALHDALAARRAGRDATLLAVGGGVVGDLAGFAAATWMRGVPFAIVSTTLLAMVDASVGGKTAVNLPAGKNLVGAFHQPRFVLADTEALRTLPDEELRSGLGEVLKCAVAGDADLFALLEARAEDVLARDPSAIAEVVGRCVRFKAAVVARDEREEGERRILNLGHTLGHALEAASGFRLRHGEAVATGLVFAARTARDLGRLPAPDAERIERLVRRLALPAELPPGASREHLAELILGDKKVHRGEPRWVLPVRIGRCAVEPVPGWRERLL